MKIAVCIKQVPDTEVSPRIKPDGTDVNLDEISKFIISPYDEFAITEAVSIAKQFPESEIVVLSVGSSKTPESLRKALAMGADRAILLKNDSNQDIDGLSLAKILSSQLKQESYDVVLFGKKAADDELGVVGGATASLLDMPFVNAITKLEITADHSSATCEREDERGTIVFKTPLPAVFSCEKGLNEPKPVALPMIMKAKKKPLDEIPITLNSVLVERTSVQEPAQRKAVSMIQGETDDKVREMVRILKEEAKIL